MGRHIELSDMYLVVVLVLLALCAALLGLVLHNQRAEGHKQAKRHAEWARWAGDVAGFVAVAARVPAPPPRARVEPPPSARSTNRVLNPSAPLSARRREEVITPLLPFHSAEPSDAAPDEEDNDTIFLVTPKGPPSGAGK